MSILGNIILYNAVSKGLAGPKIALSHIQGFVHTTLSLIILGSIPNIMQICAMTCAVLGVISITMAKI